MSKMSDEYKPQAEMSGMADEVWAAVVALRNVADGLAAFDYEMHEDAQRFADLSADLWYVMNEMGKGGAQ